VQPLGASVDAGAVRHRLIATKDADPVAAPVEIKIHDNAKDRHVYHRSVVLDLDYWVMMPRRNGRSQ
jgi:hypothetical protein